MSRIAIRRAMYALAGVATVVLLTPTITSANARKAPSVAVDSPSAGQQVTGVVDLSASVRGGAVAVTWYVDDANVGSTGDRRTSFLWNSTVVANGPHQVYASATDAGGNTSRSAAVTFSVLNAPAPTPSPTTDTPAPTSTSTGTPSDSPTPSDTSTATTTSTPAPTTSTSAQTPTADRPCVGHPAPSSYDSVVWIWFENKAPVVGSSAAPTFTSLASHCGLATDYHAITHPSLPNYLAATGGSTFGITDDNPPSSHPLGAASIFSQVGAAGRTWRSYEESMPSACALSDSGTYAVRHNPAAYFTGIRTDCAARDVPMGSTSSGAFQSDLVNDRLPAFAFVTPNACNDMHDCSVSTGDAWLKVWLPAILSSPAYGRGRTALIVTFDEDDLTADNLVSTIVVAPSVPAGTTSEQAFDHYSLLRTTEEMLGLGQIGNAATASSMRSAFHL
jgi:phosphatidylinositol-3-phosphatase